MKYAVTLLVESPLTSEDAVKCALRAWIGTSLVDIEVETLIDLAPTSDLEG